MKFFFIKKDDYQIGQEVEVHGETMRVESYVAERGRSSSKNFYAINPINGKRTLCICTDGIKIKEVTA